MDTIPEEKISKLLSLVLRHKPEHIGITLDSNGWASIDELIRKVNQTQNEFELTPALLKRIVMTCDKQRFVFSEDFRSIRANQGHSIKVDLELKSHTPPEYLYHGTAERFIKKIELSGLTSMERHHVHLTEHMETAKSVGQRYGKPVLLKIKARLMHQNGYTFFLTDNDVWLTDSVPVEYIDIP
jgi:putative RNA 2'-phosphotransferase